MSVGLYFAISIIILVGAVVQGSIGFGFALVVTPLMMLIVEPGDMVLRVMLLSQFNSAIMAWRLKNHIDFTLVWPLIIASLFGSVLGGYLLGILGDLFIYKIIVALLVIIITALMLVGYRKPIKNEKAGAVVAGFISGKLGTLTTFGGPPVVFLLTSQNREPIVFRASLAAYFFLSGFYSIPAVLFFTEANITIIEVACYVPSALIGLGVGFLLSRKISKKTFHIIVSVLMIFFSVYIIATSLISQVG